MIAFKQMAMDLCDLHALTAHPEHGETARISYREHLLALRQTIDAELASLDSAPTEEPPPIAQGDALPEKSAGLDPSRRGKH